MGELADKVPVPAHAIPDGDAGLVASSLFRAAEGLRRMTSQTVFGERETEAVEDAVSAFASAYAGYRRSVYKLLAVRDGTPQ